MLGVVGVVGNSVSHFCPVVRVGLIQHFDIVQHLDPIGRVPAGHDQPQGKSVYQGQFARRSWAKAIHHLLARSRAAWSMSNDFMKCGASAHDRLFQAP